MLALLRLVVRPVPSTLHRAVRHAHSAVSIRPPASRSVANVPVVPPRRVPEWKTQRDVSLRIKALPSAHDVLQEFKTAKDTMNLRNMVTCLHVAASKVRRQDLAGGCAAL
jgi:hypothetical protein